MRTYSVIQNGEMIEVDQEEYSRLIVAASKAFGIWRDEWLANIMREQEALQAKAEIRKQRYKNRYLTK
jgi:hypothetical protein